MRYIPCIYLTSFLLHNFSQKTLMRTYGGLARFIVQMGMPVVDGLKRLEGNKINITAYGLRNLEQLLTPTSREEVMITLNNPDVKLQDLDRAIQKARHAMWCGFVWREHPDIDQSKSVSSFSHLSHSTHIHHKNESIYFFGGARLSLRLLFLYLSHLRGGSGHKGELDEQCPHW
jgi:hypothetical protein